MPDKRSNIGDLVKPVPWRGFDRAVLIGVAVMALLNFLVLIAVFLGG